MAPIWTYLKALLLVPLVLAAPNPAPVPEGELASRALTPDTDPFYTPPAGFESTAPGTILKSRTVISALLGLVPTGVQTYQLLYRTTAINGSAIAGVTTIFVPPNAKKDRFVAFHTAYDGSSTLCNPSYSYQLLSAQVDLISDVEFLIVELYINSGYIVSSSDYEGPDAAFAPGRIEGVVALDSMRAVTNFKKTLGFTTNTPKIVGVGYSGGAIATGWAAALQPGYAPELNVVGWSMGGTPANLTGTALYIDNTAFSGFLIAAVDGLNSPSTYAQQIGPVIDSITTPYAKSLLEFARHNCIADLFVFAEQSFLSTKITSLGDRLYYQPDIAAVLHNCTLGVVPSETPQKPVYIYHATKDEIIPYSNATTLVDSWCDDGIQSLEYVTYASGGHLTTEVIGVVGSYQFVQSAFAGTVAAGGCTRSTSYNSSVDPLALGLDLEPLLTGLIDSLAALGRLDSGDLGAANSTVST